MAGRRATDLARRLSALPEAAMRAHVLAETLLRTPDQELPEMVAVLDEIQAAGREGGPPFDLAMMALAQVLADETLGYERTARIYAEARAAGHEGLTQLFFSGHRVREAPRQEGPPREYTLGHRKWQARSTDREVLGRLIQDPEEQVMPNLLRNPRLVEQDVVRIASKRPVDPRVLGHVFASPRWIARYPVKRTLVLNPYTPTDLSLRLLSLLNQKDLALVAGLSNLPEVVQRVARRTLAERRRGRGRPKSDK